MLKVVKITAIWCSGCLYMNKIWNKLMQEKKFETVELDFDNDREEVKKYNPGDILPVFIFFKDNIEIRRFAGELSEKKLIKLVDELL